MDIKTFFALNEGTMNEMAAIEAADVALNTDLFRQMKDAYGTWRDGDVEAVGTGGYYYAWPIGTRGEDRKNDVSTWLAKSLQKGLNPHNPNDIPTDQATFEKLVSKKTNDLNWAFNPDNFASTAGKKSWEAAHAAGFITPEQFARFKQIAAKPASQRVPAMTKTITTKKAWTPGQAAPAAAPAAPPPEAPPEMAQAAASAPPPEAAPVDDFKAQIARIKSDPAALAALMADLGISGGKKSGKKK